MWHFHHGYHYGFHWMWLLTFISIFVIGYLFYRGDKASDKKSVESAMDILKKRYANGEISTQEFEEMKKKLE